MTQLFQLSFCIFFVFLLVACSSGRYQQKHDSIPTRLPNQAELKEPTPRAEPYSRGGNKDYQVFNKPYKVLTTAQGFEEIGIASWYGKKFHGHFTSNGEIYDMYAMSAAHKNLPLPTYVKVTNIDNNKSVIVRVNDRGPFHESRIIDLSYSAAYKLDMLKTGTAHVKVTAITEFDKRTGLPIYVIDPNKEQTKQEVTTPIKSSAMAVDAINKTDDTQTVTQNSQTASNTVIAPITPSSIEIVDNSTITKGTIGVMTPYIQVFATSNKTLAINTTQKLQAQYKKPTSYTEQEGIYRIQLGPIKDLTTLNSLLSALKENGYPEAFPKSSIN